MDRLSLAQRWSVAGATPVLMQFNLGNEPQKISFDGEVRERDLLVGEGAIVVPADDVEGFAQALVILLSDDEMRTETGRRARRITVPYFTWEARTQDLLDDLGVTLGGGKA